MLEVVRDNAPPAPPGGFTRSLKRAFPDCSLRWSGVCWVISKRVPRLVRAGKINGVSLSVVEDREIPVLTVEGREPDSRDIENLKHMRWLHERETNARRYAREKKELEDREKKERSASVDALLNDEGGTITQHRRTFA
jgi:hypothetical protein